MRFAAFQNPLGQAGKRSPTAVHATFRSPQRLSHWEILSTMAPLDIDSGDVLPGARSEYLFGIYSGRASTETVLTVLRAHA